VTLSRKFEFILRKINSEVGGRDFNKLLEYKSISELIELEAAINLFFQKTFFLS
jgi:hypothetical protein